VVVGGGGGYPLLGGMLHLVGEPTAPQLQQGRAVYLPPVQVGVHAGHVPAHPARSKEGARSFCGIARQKNILFILIIERQTITSLRDGLLHLLLWANKDLKRCHTAE